MVARRRARLRLHEVVVGHVDGDHEDADSDQRSCAAGR
jgi:hypothetical protein